MKKADIKVGDRLAYATSDYQAERFDGREVEVLQTDLKAKARGFGNSVPGTFVRFVDVGREQVVSNRSLRMPWSEWVEGKITRTSALEVARNHRVDVMTAELEAAKRVDAALIELGRPRDWWPVGWRQDEEFEAIQRAGFPTKVGEGGERFFESTFRPERGKVDIEIAATLADAVMYG